ncbi:MAG TPA: sigma 54-interacting transcriptional regulator, partial [Acidobacteriota bacterium]
ILHHAKTMGLLYLENNLATDVFTPDRVQVVQILASQAAISLENALLYEDMKQESLQRKDAEETLRSIMEGTASFTGSDFFQSLVKHLAHSLNLKYAFITECTDSSNTELRTLAFWNGQGYGENFSYSIKGTPCEEVARDGKECFYPKNLQELFPEDTGLVDINAHSYFGVPLLNFSGRVLGHIMVMDDREMTGTPRDFSILRIFAARASAELERIRTEAALIQTAAELRFVNDLVRQTNQPVAVADFNGRLVRFNQAYEQLTGYSADELRNLTYQQLTPSSWHEQEEKLITQLKKEQKPIRYEKEYRKKNGQIVAVELVADIYKNEAGEALFLYAFVTDITERKRAEKALREALTEVENLKNRLQAENIYLQEEIKTQHNFEEIIGSSIAIRRVFQSIERVARTDSTTLITGETGTGKELVARAIHNLSARKESALIKVNCAALPSGLIESELFGHEKGAFTGASARKRGRFELADQGSLFLDEIGELPLETQTKLLRVLQEQEFERIGGSQTIKVNVRLIAATNRNLEDLVKQGSFRADLFYRLNIFPIHLPALRERRDDIPLLTNYFVSRFSRTMGKKIDQVSADALESLLHYEWPGNVRELANVLERAVILCDGGVLQKEHIGISTSPTTTPDAVPSLNEAEKLHILKALEKTKWVVGGPAGAAKLLGLNRTTLLARMKKLGIFKPV